MTTFSFQIRADTASSPEDGAGSSATRAAVNVKWLANNVITDLGIFHSNYASNSGDSPWRTVSVDVTAVYDPVRMNKVEISHIAETLVPGTPVAFNYNGSNGGSGSEQTYTVPQNCYTIEVDAYGAGGQYNGYSYYSPYTFNRVNEGFGGRVKSRISVTPGEVLKIYVGGAGYGDTAGWNGGGWGGGLSGGGTGGGGATDIRRAPYGMADRLLVAGGGGGAGDYSQGGHGGGLVGQDGLGDGYGGTSPGKGGSQSAGGANGAGTLTGGPNSGAGAFGYGGHAQNTNPGGYGQGCGGGGGGWYGGGCGGPNGWNEGAPGGGGSSYTVGTVILNDQGVRQSHGVVTVTPIGSTYVVSNDPALSDRAHIRNVWLDYGDGPDYGQFPRGFNYTEDVQDGVIDSNVIMNDGGTPPGAAYFAEQGPDIPASPLNYSINWPTYAGLVPSQVPGWSTPYGIWEINGDGLIVHGNMTDQGTTNVYGHKLCIRSDGTVSARKHVVEAYVTSYGSRGEQGHGLVWGYNGPDDYYYLLNPNDTPGEWGRCLNGVRTAMGGITNGWWGWLKVEHDFVTGHLKITTTDAFLGGVAVDYDGIVPHTVTNGKVGIFARPQSGGAFWGAAITGSFSLTYQLADPGHNRQYSMQTNAVVAQSPATWWFRPSKFANWVVGALGFE